MKYSRIMSSLTAAYGVYALVKPRHLADAIEAPELQAPAVDQMALTYGVRDLAISGAALLSRNPSVVTTAMVMRIVGDLGDATVLGVTGKPSVRPKVLGVTLTWAVLNAAALVADRRALAS